MAKDSRTEGKTLAEALLAWGDPAAVAEMTELAEGGYDGPGIFSLEGPVTGCERKVFRYQELRSQLEQELTQKLRDGSLVATGYDSRAAIDAPPVAVPADRWRVLTPILEDSSATAAGMAITGILVYEGDPATVLPASLTEPRLEIRRRARRVRLGDTGVSLSPRSFDLLLMLAEAAVTVEAPVPRSDIEDRLWSGYVSKKAVADAVNKLKAELETQGVVEAADCPLIINHRVIGYRLTITPAEIRILD